MEFEKFRKLTSEKKRPKHEHTDSYFYLAIQLAKCMMRSHNLNRNDYGGYTKMTAPSSNVYSTDEDESKRIIVHGGLSQSCSTNEGESKRSIFNKILSQNYSADVDKICSTEKDISEYTINKQKDTEYKESSFTKEVPSYFNIFECGRNILDRLDVMYEQVCMATPKDKYYEKMLETLVDENNLNSASLYNENLRQVVNKVMEETESEFERNINKITIDTSFQSPIQKKDISTINDSRCNDSNNQVDKISDSKEQVDTSSRSRTESVGQVDPISDPRLDTHITDGIQKLSIRPITFDPVVIGQDLVTSVQETSRESLSQESLKPLHTIRSKEIITDAACNSTQVDRIVWTPSRDIHMTPRVNIEVFSPSRCSNSSSAKCSRNIKPLNNSVDKSVAQERNSNCSCIEKIGVKSLPGEIVTDLDPSKRVNLTSYALRESPKFIDFGLLSFNATSKKTPSLPPLPEQIA